MLVSDSPIERSKRKLVSLLCCRREEESKKQASYNFRFKNLASRACWTWIRQWAEILGLFEEVQPR